jgi:RNA recognition motif-containing protein
LKVITDRKTGKCRGFGFVTVGSDEVADTVIEKFNGYDFNGAVLKLEKALPRTKGKGEESSNEEGTDESVKSDVESSSSVAAPVKAAAKRKKRNNNKKSTGSSSSSSASSTEAHQPDPRWASDLERLKQQLLEAQGAAK